MRTPPPPDFTGRVLLVTGAARGIGAGVARGYVAHGGRVALLGVETERLASLATELGDAAAWWEADVRDAHAVTRAVDAAAEHFGRIDHVLANAGIASYGTVRQIDDETFSRVVDVNISGVYRTLHAGLPHLERTSGYVLVIASLASFTTLPGLAPYCASKAGVEALALATRQEVAHLGVGVGVCHPSWVDTDIVRVAETDLPVVAENRASLPYPANVTTSLDDCVTAILDGLRRRPARLYIPRGVAVANWARAALASPLAWRLLRRTVARRVPRLEREVRDLGRFTHAHTPLTPPRR